MSSYFSAVEVMWHWIFGSKTNSATVFWGKNDFAVVVFLQSFFSTHPCSATIQLVRAAAKIGMLRAPTSKPLPPALPGLVWGKMNRAKTALFFWNVRFNYRQDIPLQDNPMTFKAKRKLDQIRPKDKNNIVIINQLETLVPVISSSCPQALPPLFKMWWWGWGALFPRLL